MGNGYSELNVDISNDSNEVLEATTLDSYNLNQVLYSKEKAKKLLEVVGKKATLLQCSNVTLPNVGTIHNQYVYSEQQRFSFVIPINTEKKIINSCGYPTVDYIFLTPIHIHNFYDNDKNCFLPETTMQQFVPTPLCLSEDTVSKYSNKSHVHQLSSCPPMESCHPLADSMCVELSTDIHRSHKNELQYNRQSFSFLEKLEKRHVDTIPQNNNKTVESITQDATSNFVDSSSFNWNVSIPQGVDVWVLEKDCLNSDFYPGKIFHQITPSGIPKGYQTCFNTLDVVHSMTTQQLFLFNILNGLNLWTIDNTQLGLSTTDMVSSNDRHDQDVSNHIATPFEIIFRYSNVYIEKIHYLMSQQSNDDTTLDDTGLEQSVTYPSNHTTLHIDNSLTFYPDLSNLKTDVCYQDCTSSFMPNAIDMTKTFQDLNKKMTLLCDSISIHNRSVNGIIIGKLVHLCLYPLLHHKTLNHIKESHSYPPIVQQQQQQPLLLNKYVLSTNLIITNDTFFQWNIIHIDGGKVSYLESLLSSYSEDISVEQFKGHPIKQKKLSSTQSTISVIRSQYLAIVLDQWLTFQEYDFPVYKDTHHSTLLTHLPDVINYIHHVSGVPFVLTQSERSFQCLSFIQQHRLLFDSLPMSQMDRLKNLPMLTSVLAEYFLCQGMRFSHLFGPSSKTLWSLTKGLTLLFVVLSSHDLQQGPTAITHYCMVKWTHLNETFNLIMNNASFFTLSQMITAFIQCVHKIYLNAQLFPNELLNDNQKHESFIDNTIVSFAACPHPLRIIIDLLELTDYSTLSHTDILPASLQIRLQCLHTLALFSSLCIKYEQFDQLYHPTISLHSVYKVIIQQLKHLMKLSPHESNDTTVSDITTLSNTLWNLCEHCIHLISPPLNLTCISILHDVYYFSNEWVSNSFKDITPLRSYLITQSIPPFGMCSILRLNHYLILSLLYKICKQIGHTVHLIQLHLNTEFFHKLLSYKDANESLQKELIQLKDHRYPNLKKQFLIQSRHRLSHDVSDQTSFESSSYRSFIPFFLNHFFGKLPTPLCLPHVEFMNFVEVTETNFCDHDDDQYHRMNINKHGHVMLNNNTPSILQTHRVNQQYVMVSDVIDETDMRQTMYHDILEWLKGYCWNISFPGLQWNYGCEWTHHDTIITTVIQTAPSLNSHQVIDILKDEIYHSSSTHGVRSIEWIASAPKFLIDSIYHQYELSHLHRTIIQYHQQT